MSYPLNQVLAETLDRHFDEKYNVYAVLEILKYPEKYPNIHNVIFFDIGLLQDYEYYFCEEKTGEKPDAPDDTDEEAWLALLAKDTEWLESYGKLSGGISCAFFDDVVENLRIEPFVNLPMNVCDAYWEDVDELYRAFVAVSDSVSDNVSSHTEKEK